MTDKPEIPPHRRRKPKAVTEPAPEGSVLVFRHPGTDRPVAVPSAVVEISERPYRAWMMRVAGSTWEEVAAVESYSSTAAAAADVKRYTDEGASLVADRTKRTMIEMELARLDVLQRALWDDATQGHVAAVTASLSVINTRIKLLGLAEIVAGIDDDVARPTTVIVPSDNGGYREALEQVSKTI